MAASMRSQIFGIFFFLLISLAASTRLHRKFEYKLSFKGPHLVQPDGTIPFWEHGGHAIASDESIRVTPSLRSKRGYVWSKMANEAKNWEVEVSFRVNGRGRVGADGLAIWFTEDRVLSGPVFGGPDKWRGLGVFFDSFDNDAQHNNPYVMAMRNDGTISYDHNSDGMQQQLGGCLRDFRNKPYAVKARIEYLNNALTIWVHNGVLANDDFEMCMRVENIQLPAKGYFGVTAATGGLADDHDVGYFITHSLIELADSATKPAVTDEERKKFETEFDEYYKKLQDAKDQYKLQHPEMKQELDEDAWFEAQNDRELNQIHQGQQKIHLTITELHRKMDEIIGRQERTLSQLSMIQNNAAQQGQQGKPQQLAPSAVTSDSIKRFEVDQIIRQQIEAINTLNSFKDTLQHIKTGTGTGNAAATGYQDPAMKHQINTILTDIKTLVSRGERGCPVPEQPNCVTSFYMFCFLGLQMVIAIAYAMYRSNKDAAAKKFY